MSAAADKYTVLREALRPDSKWNHTTQRQEFALAALARLEARQEAMEKALDRIADADLHNLLWTEMQEIACVALAALPTGDKT